MKVPVNVKWISVKDRLPECAVDSCYMDEVTYVTTKDAHGNISVRDDVGFLRLDFNYFDWCIFTDNSYDTDDWVPLYEAEGEEVIAWTGEEIEIDILPYREEKR